VIFAPHPEGVVLTVRAQPGAKRPGVTVDGERLKVAVSAPPEDGRANAAVVELLREFFGRKRSEVELLTGPTSRQKSILLRGITEAEVRAKLGI